MTDKMYKVIADKYTGKHRVYKKGDELPEAEIFGDKDVAINGQKAYKKKDKDYAEIKRKLIPVEKKGSKK